MKTLSRLIFLLVLVSILSFGCAPATSAPTAVPTVAPTETPIPVTPTPALPAAVEKLHWFGTSSILYQGSQTIYFDPVTLSGELPPADLILVTHAHNDHWSVDDLLKIIGPQTTLVIGYNASGVYEQSKDRLGIEAQVLKEGESLEVNGLQIQAVPAYDTRFHLREGGGVGFIVTVDGERIYHAGGTAVYPEMAQNECDVAIIPMYSNKEVKELAAIIPAKVIAVTHTSFTGSESYASVLGKDFPDKKFVTFASGTLQP